MASVTLNPSGDTRIQKSNPSSNYGGDSYLQVGEYNALTDYVVRSLLKFDLSSIPAGSTIISATLRIYDSAANYSDNTRTMYVNRSKRAWTENGATWNKYDGTNDWSTAGGGTNSNDVELTPIGSVSMPASEVAGYVEISLTASSVQEWLDGIFTNNGIILTMGTELNDMHDFHSDEGVNRPELVVVYASSSGGSPMLFGGGVTIG